MKAVVDIGSNSVKILVAKIQRGVVRPVFNISSVTRLGRDLGKTGKLSQKSLEDTHKAFELFKREMKAYKIDELHVIATEAVRVAKNKKLIKEMVSRIFGVKLKILSGKEEAFWSFRGAAQVLKFDQIQAKDVVFIDLGGASMEVGVLSPKSLFRSFPIGAVRAFESLKLPAGIIEDKLWSQKSVQLEKNILKMGLGRWAKKLKARRSAIVIGGTLMQAARSLGAQKVGESTYFCSVAEMSEFCESLRKKSISARIKKYKVDQGRADILPAGILVVEETLKILDIDNFYVTGLGLRHGYLSASRRSS